MRKKVRKVRDFTKGSYNNPRLIFNIGIHSTNTIVKIKTPVNVEEKQFDIWQFIFTFTYVNYSA
jgi:hypothetical protein